MKNQIISPSSSDAISSKQNHQNISTPNQTNTKIPKPNMFLSTSYQPSVNAIQGAPKITENNLQNISTQKKTFAETLNPNPFPKKDQGIIFDIVNEEIQLKEYVIEIGKIIKPENIIFVSKISKKRMCIFLSSKELANKLIRDNENLVVQGQNVKLRKLFNPDKRIILANVYPNIPHEIIIQALKEHSIVPTSPISFLRAGLHIDGFTHILSFRRQMYISHEDENKIPSSLLINFENSNYRIFLSNDDLTCFLCKQIGHTSNNCTKVTEPKITETHYSQETSNTQILSEIEDPKTPIDFDTNLDFDEFMVHSPIHNKKTVTEQTQSIKRPALTLSPTLTSSTISNNEPSTSDRSKTQKTNPTKKTKVTPATESFLDNIETHLSPIKEFFDKNNVFPIDYTQFKDIIENVQNNPDPESVIDKYNISIKTMIDIVEKVRPKLQTNISKVRFTRLLNVLFKKYMDKPNSTDTQY